MPETTAQPGWRRVSSQRLVPALRSIAVALCATAFLLPGAQAAKHHDKHQAAAPSTTKKLHAAAEPKRHGTPVAERRSGRAERGAERPVASARHGRGERVARGGREMMVATIRGKKEGRIVARREGRHSMPMRFAEVPSPHLSYGQLAGLHGAEDALDLKAGAALVIDQDTREVLFSKNDDTVLPIASLTKLMTGTIISEAHLPMDEPITITEDDVDTLKNSRSRLAVGTTLSRGEMLHLALMSSENRAAHALGRTFPGGLATFVSMMNAKARELGMRETRYVEPTGLSSSNQSSARDLALLVNAASADPLLRQLTTSPEYQVEVGNRLVQFNTTNRLVKSPDWDIGVQKTGFINEAGQCLVMQTRIAGRKLIMVLLDATGKFSRIADAERIRRWVEVRQLMSNTVSLHERASSPAIVRTAG